MPRSVPGIWSSEPQVSQVEGATRPAPVTVVFNVLFNIGRSNPFPSSYLNPFCCTFFFLFQRKFKVIFISIGIFVGLAKSVWEIKFQAFSSETWDISLFIYVFFFMLLSKVLSYFFPHCPAHCWVSQFLAILHWLLLCIRSSI